MDNDYVTWVDLSLRSGTSYTSPNKRLNASLIGMRLTVKTAPQVEEYMKQLANNQKVPVDAVSDLWHNVGSEEPLEYYALNEQIYTPAYMLNKIGQPLILNNRGLEGQLRAAHAGQILQAVPNMDNDPVNGRINLSFLTLAGVSKPDGVTIGFGGVYSGQYIKSLQRSLMQSTEQFLRDYLVPVTINMQIVSRPF